MKGWWYSDLVRGARLARCPVWIWGTAGFGYLVLEFVCRHFELPAGAIYSIQPLEDPFRKMQAAAIDIAAAIFGFYRALAFHPYARPAYRKWLTTTCWQNGRPLPLGPVTLTVGDLLTVLVGMLFVWRADPRSWTLAVPCLFAASYLLAMMVLLLGEGPRGLGYLVLAGLGGMLMAATRLEIALTIAVVTYVVAWFGTRRSVARLPTYEPRPAERLTSPTLSPAVQIEIRPAAAGWPFGLLCPQPSTAGVSQFDAICISLVTGWMLLCLVEFATSPFDSAALPADLRSKYLSIGVPLGAFACLIRLFVYLGSYRPPISLAGRMATGRWIIQSYDRAFVAPLAGLLIVGAALPRFVGVNITDQPSLFEMPILVTVILLVVLLSGPKFRDWALTCECRIQTRRPQQQNTQTTLYVPP